MKDSDLYVSARLLAMHRPTSGLDSYAALSVMRHLASMVAGTGQICISCIHQPRAAIWAMFDEVCSYSALTAAC